jgi:hypothetical protein
VARVQESHKGHDIVIEEPARERGAALARAAQEEPRLSIDGRPVKVIRRSDGTYPRVSSTPSTPHSRNSRGPASTCIYPKDESLGCSLVAARILRG